MNPANRIRRALAHLYGPQQVEPLWDQVQGMIQKFQQTIASSPSFSNQPLSQADAILITYGDQFQAQGEAPLHTLGRFLDERLEGAFSGVHILPFYPYSSDDGFSVIDYYQVDPRLGDWEDITRLGRRYRLMFDAVINHISQHSRWFQAFLQGDPEYQDYFISVSDEYDRTRVVRPRTSPLLTPFETASGTRQVWTTFSADQIDLNYAHPAVLMRILDLLLFYVAHGAGIIRLDAIAYLWKAPGTPCIHLSQTHAVVRLFRAVLDLAAPQVLLITETNVPHQDNIAYFGDPMPGTQRTDEADLVYQFPLAPLVLHSLGTGSAARLSQWLDTLSAPGLFFNFLASHDGIGLMPAAGLLSPQEIGAIVERTLAHGGRVSYKANPDGTQSPYELNITLYDALNPPGSPQKEAIQRFLAAQAILLSLAGLPAIYVHSLFGSPNCGPCVEMDGKARAINREKFHLPDLLERLGDPQSRAAQVLSATLDLLQVRQEQAAFHPRGGQRLLSLAPALLSLVRTSPNGRENILCVINVSPSAQHFSVDLQAEGLPQAARWRDLINGEIYSSLGQKLEITTSGYQAVWLKPE